MGTFSREGVLASVAEPRGGVAGAEVGRVLREGGAEGSVLGAPACMPDGRVGGLVGSAAGDEIAARCEEVPRGEGERDRGRCGAGRDDWTGGGSSPSCSHTETV